MSEAIRYERRGAAAILTIDRQERRNAIDGPAAEALLRGYQAFVADDEARVLIVTGAGEVSFCAGADLKALDSLVPRVVAPGGPLGFTRLLSPKPTIAAISGWCLAGGMELALWCDIRIAAEGSTFGFPERRWGVPLVDGGTQRLPQVIGLGRALDLTLSGRMVPVAEALAIGLVNRIVPAGTHLDHALEYAQQLASFPQETMLADRRSIYDGLGRDLFAGLALEATGGLTTLGVAAQGAARFAGGEGRGGAFG
ncbi:enoyl-CoA hydratase [Rhizocola hellebori]|uniref:Enoyl-CoA hydratase n=1 Tax=Rhizocola hellebori TaxID=1392758 RepID=A0A8J3VKN3_9ACTN|nr:crotonase/enoyl-CoA hydratase family protein [Rhizocola hellebori]GIH10659.1 enoyl-CoA hydratase [Rhizocola hellebori]